MTIAGGQHAAVTCSVTKALRRASVSKDIIPASCECTTKRIEMADVLHWSADGGSRALKPLCDAAPLHSGQGAHSVPLPVEHSQVVHTECVFCGAGCRSCRRSSSTRARPSRWSPERRTCSGSRTSGTRAPTRRTTRWTSVRYVFILNLRIRFETMAISLGMPGRTTVWQAYALGNAVCVAAIYRH